MALGLRGLVAATFTPMLENGDVDLTRIPAVVNHLLANNIAGLYVLGSTGEGVSLTADERRQVAATFVGAANNRVPVIIHVGAESVRQAQELAAHAQQVGADAVSAVSPVYFKPDSPEVLVATMAEIAAAAPELPFYYYHIPGVTGVNVSAVDFLQPASMGIPTFAGIKFTSPVVHEFQHCLRLASGRYDILWGLDEMLLSGLAAGAHAAIGSTYNFAAPIYHALWKAFEQGDIATARDWQARSQEIIAAFVPFGPRGSQKEIMRLIGVDCGPPRLPVPTLTPEQSEALRAALEQEGLFSLTSVEVEEPVAS